MTIAFPYHIDGRGRTASATPDDHVRDLVEQVLFTTPGERVMRPTFGSGLLGLTFEPASAQVAASVQFLVQSALTQQLGDIITVDTVEVTAGDPSSAGAGASVVISVSWTVLATGLAGTTAFTAPGGAA